MVEGRLVAAVPGLHGKVWYLLELDKALPPEFEPLAEIPVRFRSQPVRYLLLSPSPDMPTTEVPPDLIGNNLASRTVVRVGVSIGAKPDLLPHGITLDHVPILFPGLCSGRLEAL